MASAGGKRQRTESEGSAASVNEEVALVPTKKTFASLGVTPVLCEACAALGWAFASPIQAEALPLALHLIRIATQVTKEHLVVVKQ